MGDGVSIVGALSRCQGLDGLGVKLGANCKPAAAAAVMKNVIDLDRATSAANLYASPNWRSICLRVTSDRCAEGNTVAYRLASTLASAAGLSFGERRGMTEGVSTYSGPATIPKKRQAT